MSHYKIIEIFVKFKTIVKSLEFLFNQPSSQNHVTTQLKICFYFPYMATLLIIPELNICEPSRAVYT